MKTNFDSNGQNISQSSTIQKTKNLIDMEKSYSEIQAYFKQQNASIELPKEIDEAAYFIYKMDQLLKDQKEKEKLLYYKTISS